ncbi:Uncharacterized protein Adt_24403 [Abeliophyllum distichum]|uniref:Uncharacterized protein n=1 Tax=Abeliophyllum distichum TaxID=126358 RepID=A0ABD1SEN5_9LAMI
MLEAYGSADRATKRQRLELVDHNELYLNTCNLKHFLRAKVLHKNLLYKTQGLRDKKEAKQKLIQRMRIFLNSGIGPLGNGHKQEEPRLNAKVATEAVNTRPKPSDPDGVFGKSP